MGIFVATAATIFCDQYDFTSDVNEVNPSVSKEEKDATTFGSGGEQALLAGIERGSVQLSTFTDTSLIEPAAFANLGGTTLHVITVTPTGVANDRAMILRGLESKFTEGVKVGDVSKLDVHVSETGSEGIVEGYLVLPKTTAAANSTGAVQNDGAVLTGQKVYGALHVFAASGTTPNLAVTVKSAALVGFGSPTTRLTFAAQTAAGSDFQSAAGPITDAFWRVDYTITGTTPSFTFAVAIGIK